MQLLHLSILIEPGKINYVESKALCTFSQDNLINERHGNADHLIIDFVNVQAMTIRLGKKTHGKNYHYFNS